MPPELTPRTFVCADSDLEALPSLREEGVTFDLILTDPPYNLGKDFGNNSDKLSLDQFLDVNRKRAQICSELLAPGGSILWFGIHHYIGFLQVLMYEAGLFYRRMNIWRYENGFSRSQRVPRGEFEPFLWFSKSQRNWTYNADDVRMPYKSTNRLKTPVYYRSSNGQLKPWRPHPSGAMHGDVWEYPTLAGKRFAHERVGHPTQKPEALIRDLIRAFCPKASSGRYGGKILDPFAGTGTVGICAEQLNREGHEIDWYCVEIEPRWVEVSNRRLAAIRAAML